MLSTILLGFLDYISNAFYQIFTRIKGRFNERCRDSSTNYLGICTWASAPWL